MASGSERVRAALGIVLGGALIFGILWSDCHRPELVSPEAAIQKAVLRAGARFLQYWSYPQYSRWDKVEAHYGTTREAEENTAPEKQGIVRVELSDREMGDVVLYYGLKRSGIVRAEFWGAVPLGIRVSTPLRVGSEREVLRAYFRKAADSMEIVGKAGITKIGPGDGRVFEVLGAVFEDHGATTLAFFDVQTGELRMVEYRR